MSARWAESAHVLCPRCGKSQPIADTSKPQEFTCPGCGEIFDYFPVKR